MKLLLDECVDQRLRIQIPDHEIYSVAFMGWSSVKNGELLRRAAAEKFDVLLTTDRSIQYQHNLATLPLSVVWLDAASNDVEDLAPLVPGLLTILHKLSPRSFASVHR